MGRGAGPVTNGVRIDQLACSRVFTKTFLFLVFISKGEGLLAPIVMRRYEILFEGTRTVYQLSLRLLTGYSRHGGAVRQAPEQHCCIPRYAASARYVGTIRYIQGNRGR